MGKLSLSEVSWEREKSMLYVPMTTNTQIHMQSIAFSSCLGINHEF